MECHMKNRLQLYTFLILSIATTSTLYADDGDGMMNGMCPMCANMGPWGMILGVAFALATIAALVALTMFLVRRSKGPHAPFRGES